MEPSEDIIDLYSTWRQAIRVQHFSFLENNLSLGCYNQYHGPSGYKQHKFMSHEDNGKTKTRPVWVGSDESPFWVSDL